MASNSFLGTLSLEEDWEGNPKSCFKELIHRPAWKQIVHHVLSFQDENVETYYRFQMLLSTVVHCKKMFLQKIYVCIFRQINIMQKKRDNNRKVTGLHISIAFRYAALVDTGLMFATLHCKRYCLKRMWNWNSSKPKMRTWI